MRSTDRCWAGPCLSERFSVDRAGPTSDITIPGAESSALAPYLPSGRDYPRFGTQGLGFLTTRSKDRKTTGTLERNILQPIL
jgi:hypothetical protein